MPLQIRRGPTVDRLAYTPLEGELIFDMSTKILYVGDGTTAGGVGAGTFNYEDAQDAAANLLTSGIHSNISFEYNDTAARVDARLDLSVYDGTISATGFKGTLFADDSSVLVNAATGSINLDGTVKGDIIPNSTSLYDIGDSSHRFKDLYLSGSTIYLGNASISSTGSAVNLPAGSTVGGVLIAEAGAGIVPGSNYNINIVGDDSTAIVNAAAKEITAAGGFFGNLTGNVLGNVQGTLTGNVITNYINSADSSEIILLTSLKGLSDIRCDNEFVGRLRGDVTGNITGNVYGSVYTLSNTKSYDRDLNVYYPNGIEFVGRSIITSQTNDLSVSIQTVGFESDTFNITKNSYTGTSPWVQLSQYHNTADADNLTFTRARGTFEAPTTIQSGDDIIDIAFAGYDGAAFRVAGAITVSVTGAVSSNIVPSRMTFQTHGTTSASNATRMTIDSTSVSFTSAPKVPVYANASARDTAIPSPLQGMIIFNSNTSKFQGNIDGTVTGWQDLN